MQSPFDLLALLLVLAAIFGYLNHRFLGLPLTVGLLLMALLGAMLLIAAGAAMPQLGLKPALRGLLAQVNFPVALLNGFLSFLLFAGALEVDFAELFGRKWTVLALAVFGTVLSTGLIAVGLWAVLAVLGIGIPLAWCLVFGALISPTDPVAVLLVLRRVGIPRYLQAIIAGESLFNDGIGVVLFSLLLSLAVGSGEQAHGPLRVAGEFLLSAVGGGVLGLVLGYAAFVLLRGVDDYNVELIISLALVTGTYSLAGLLDVSGPVAVVVAGILIGNHGMRLGDERVDPAASEDVLAAGRRHLECAAVPADRARDRGDRSGLARARRHRDHDPGRARRALAQRHRLGPAAQSAPAGAVRVVHGADLGRAAWRDLGGVGAGIAADRL